MLLLRKIGYGLLFPALLLLLLSSTPAVPKPASRAKTLIEEMLLSMSKVYSATSRVRRLERLRDGSTITGEMQFKAMFEPRLKAYIHINSPKEGTEVLYVDGWNDNKALVNPNGFPWINVSLDPEGSSMLEKTHHSLKCLGFQFTEGIVRHLYQTHLTDFDAHAVYVGDKQWNTRLTHIVKFVYDDYGPVKYTVQGNENMCQIERRIWVPAASILNMNPDVDDYWDLTPGQVINVPNYYGKESVFMIDAENHLPIVQIISDEKGILEKYEYHDLVVNPKFNTAEFTKDYPDYDF